MGHSIAVLLYAVAAIMVFGGTSINPKIGAYGLIVFGVAMLFHLKVWLWILGAIIAGFTLGVRR